MNLKEITLRDLFPLVVRWSNRDHLSAFVNYGKYNIKVHGWEAQTNSYLTKESVIAYLSRDKFMRLGNFSNERFSKTGSSSRHWVILYPDSGASTKKIVFRIVFFYKNCRRPIEKCLESISRDSPEIQKMRRFQKTSIQCHFISKIPQFRGQVYSILSFSDNVQALYWPLMILLRWVIKSPGDDFRNIVKISDERHWDGIYQEPHSAGCY